MRNEIQKLDARIEALRAKRAALVREEEKRAEQRVIAAARRAGLLQLPPEQLAAIFETLVEEQHGTDGAHAGDAPGV